MMLPNRKIILKDNTFVWKDSQHILLYNTDNHHSVLFPVDSGVEELYSQWTNTDNLYKASPSVWTDTVIAFVKEIEDMGVGIIAEEQERIFSIPPILKIKHSVENKDRWGPFDSQEILPYLHKLIFFLGGGSNNHNYWKQVLWPMCSKERLNGDRLIDFVAKYDNSFLQMVAIIISDAKSGVWIGGEKKPLTELASRLYSVKDKVRFFFADLDSRFDNAILNQLTAEGFRITQVCLPDMRINVGNWVKDCYYQLLVRNEDDVEYWESLLGKDKDVNYEFKPIADNNLEFFKKNVFLSEEEILSQKLTKKDIFRHQALNVTQFGTLYVFPDDTIHPATDAPAIGTLEDSAHQLVLRELEDNHAWRQTRRLMEPCKQCIYHDLCPSPSVYERILGIPGCTYWKG